MAVGRKIEIEMKFEVATPGGADRYLVAPELGPHTDHGDGTARRQGGAKGRRQLAEDRRGRSTRRASH